MTVQEQLDSLDMILSLLTEPEFEDFLSDLGTMVYGKWKQADSMEIETFFAERLTEQQRHRLLKEWTMEIKHRSPNAEQLAKLDNLIDTLSTQDNGRE